MPITRIYCNQTLRVGDEIILTEDAHHKLTKVLRAKVGDQVWLFNGAVYDSEAGDFLATITQLNKKNLTLSIIKFVAGNQESPLTIELAQALPKAEKMDFILQKSVELGVTHLVPLITTRTNLRLTQEQALKKTQHWQAVIQHACEQSGRNKIPQCDKPTNYTDWLKEHPVELGLVLQPNAKVSLDEVLNPIASKAAPLPKISICIGPEGGLTPEELALAERYGFKTVSLGSRVLRTETASLALIAILQYCYGDLRKIG